MWSILLLVHFSGEFSLQVHPTMQTCGEFLARMYDKEIHESGHCIDLDVPSGPPAMPWAPPPPARPDGNK